MERDKIGYFLLMLILMIPRLWCLCRKVLCLSYFGSWKLTIGFLYIVNLILIIIFPFIALISSKVVRVIYCTFPLVFHFSHQTCLELVLMLTAL